MCWICTTQGYAIVIFSSEKTSAYSENIGKDDVDTSEEKTLSLSFNLNIAMEVDAQNVHLPGDLGILELIDKQINFRTQELWHEKKNKEQTC